MSEFHVVRVQGLPGHVFHIRIIQIIADQWKSQIFHMNTDLMGTAGFEPQRDQTVSVRCLYELIVCNGFFSVFKINHALNDGSFFSGKRSTDDTGRGSDTAFYNGKIFPVYFSVFCHGRKDTSADQMLGYDGQAGSVTVQTVAAAEDEKGFPCFW